MFDPMPQPKKSTHNEQIGFERAIKLWRRQRKIEVAKRVFMFCVLVVSLALILAATATYMGVICSTNSLVGSAS